MEPLNNAFTNFMVDPESKDSIAPSALVVIALSLVVTLVVFFSLLYQVR